MAVSVGILMDKYADFGEKPGANRFGNIDGPHPALPTGSRDLSALIDSIASPISDAP